MPQDQRNLDHAQRKLAALRRHDRAQRDSERRSQAQHVEHASSQPVASSVASPLLLATVPSDEDTARGQHQSLAPSGHRSLGNDLIYLLTQLKAPVEALFASSSQSVRHAELAMEHIENELLRRDPGDFHMMLAYSDPRSTKQLLACEVIRRCGLVLIETALYVRRRNPYVPPKLDMCIQSLLMLDLAGLARHSTASVLWALSIAGPFVDGMLKEVVATHFASAATALQLFTWEQCRSYLESLLYYPAVQDLMCPRFWNECTRSAGASRMIDEVDDEDFVMEGSSRG